MTVRSVNDVKLFETDNEIPTILPGCCVSWYHVTVEVSLFGRRVILLLKPRELGRTNLTTENVRDFSRNC